MSKFTVTIIGTGVIGTSLGLALKQAGEPPRLLGHDKDFSTAKEAARTGAFDKVDWNLINACEPADLIILAIPLSGVRATLEAIASYLKKGAVVSDTTPNKTAVLSWATELLPEHAHFVGGNPIVQAAGLGHEHASDSLFRERLYCLTPAPSAQEEAVQLLVSLVSLVGAEPFFLDPAEHDGLVAAAEHLPALASLALVRALTQQESWREMRKLAGRTFERVSAGAEGDPDGLKDNLLQNRQMMLHLLDQYLAQLHHFRSMLSAEEAVDEAMAQEIDQAVVARLNWLKDYQTGDFTDPALRSSSKVEIPGLLERMVGFGRFRKRGSDDK